MVGVVAGAEVDKADLGGAAEAKVVAVVRSAGLEDGIAFAGITLVSSLGTV